MATNILTCNLKNNKKGVRLSEETLFFLKKNIFYIILFLTIGILFSIYVCFSPCFYDDYSYTFFRVENLKNFYPRFPLLSLYTDNFAGVSRLIPHLIIGFFQKTDKSLFNIFTSIAFLIFGLVTARVATDDRNRILPLALISCGVLFMVPKYVFFITAWLSGAPNYMYVGIIVSFFILLLRRGREIFKNKVGNCLSLFFFGLITGWSNEGFIIGLTAASIIYYGIIKRKELNINRKSMIWGLFMGCLFLCLSPFNVYKFLKSHTNHYNDLNNLFEQLMISVSTNIILFRVLPLVLISLVAFFLYFLFCGKGEKGIIFIKEWCKDNLFIIITLIVSLGFQICTLFVTSRSRFPVEFYALLLLLNLISKGKGQLLKILSVTISVLSIGLFLYILPAVKYNYKAQMDIVAQIKGNKSLIITKHIPTNFLLEHYLNPPQIIVYPHIHLAAVSIALYNNSDLTPTIIDEDVYKILSVNNEPWKIYHKNEWEASYIKIPENKEVESVKVIVNHENLMHNKVSTTINDKILQNQIRKSMPFEINGRKWLMVPDHKLLKNIPIKIELKVKEQTEEPLYPIWIDDFIPTQAEMR